METKDFFSPTLGIKISYPSDWYLTSSKDNQTISIRNSEDQAKMTELITISRRDLRSQLRGRFDIPSTEDKTKHLNELMTDTKGDLESHIKRLYDFIKDYGHNVTLTSLGGNLAIRTEYAPGTITILATNNGRDYIDLNYERTPGPSRLSDEELERIFGSFEFKAS
jgi:hypothetical protein